MTGLDETTAAFAEQWWDAKAETLWINTFMGLPCLQHPFDAWITSEIIWSTKPEVLVECGSYGGGSAAMWAAHMEFYAPSPTVISIDVLNRVHLARDVPVWKRCVEFIEGSSLDGSVIERVGELCEGKRTMVILDSLHTEQHVTDELSVYSPLVSPGCYLIVQDSFINGHPLEPDMGPGPYEAIQKFITRNDSFEVDESRERMMFTFNPSGFLRRKP